MDILYNNEGVPLMMHSDIAFYDTKLDKQTVDERRRVLFPYDDTRHDFIEVAGLRVLSWAKTICSHGTLPRLCAIQQCLTLVLGFCAT